MEETKTIGQYLADLNYASILPEILQEMKFLLFDYLGVTIGGTETESGRIAAQFSKDLEEKEEATIIGFGYRVSAPGAAFTNAILSHSLELDDVDSQSYFHFSSPIFSAALAMAEREHASGKDLLVAFVAGCDLMARLSSTMNPSHRNRGFHTTSTCGVFGAAAASAKLLHLRTEEIMSALGLAGAQASGLMEFFGPSMQKRFNPGPAARGGTISALLAQRGFTGSDTILEGDRGFLKAYSDQLDPSKLVDELGKKFPIHIDYKPYACLRAIHNAIDCALSLKRTYHIDPAQISRIIVYRHPAWADYHNVYKVRTFHEAQVSLAYAVAVSFVEGKAFLEQYSEDKIMDPRVQKLLKLVESQAAPHLPREVSCKMEVTLQNGTRHAFQVDYPKGSIQNPLSQEERREKFKSLSLGLLNEKRQKQLEEIIFELEKMRDTSELLHLVTGQIK